jgi:hypothetical protein
MAQKTMDKINGLLKEKIQEQDFLLDTEKQNFIKRFSLYVDENFDGESTFCVNILVASNNYNIGYGVLHEKNTFSVNFKATKGYSGGLDDVMGDWIFSVLCLFPCFDRGDRYKHEAQPLNPTYARNNTHHNDESDN